MHVQKTELPPVKWLVYAKDESPITAEMTTITVPLNKYRELIITNTIHGVHTDAWFIFVRHISVRGRGPDDNLAFVGCGSIQTRAWQEAHVYCWNLYRVNIGLFQLPF
jgi:hypothetical protein